MVSRSPENGYQLLGDTPEKRTMRKEKRETAKITQGCGVAPEDLLEVIRKVKARRPTGTSPD